MTRKIEKIPNFFLLPLHSPALFLHSFILYIFFIIYLLFIAFFSLNWFRRGSCAEGQDGRPHLIYQRPEKVDQPELKKRKSLLKAFSFIDISPDGISVMGTPLVKSTKEKEKVKEKAREKEERKREKRLLRDQEREQEHQLQLVSIEETRVLALDKGKEREIDPAERESSREQDLRPTAALHRVMEREAEALREQLREQDRASGADPRDKYKNKEGGKRWSLTNLRRSHVQQLPPLNPLSVALCYFARLLIASAC